MMLYKVSIFVAMLGLVLCANQTDKPLKDDHSMDPAFYSCPFSMFDAGHPVTLESGEVMYCDADDATCPSWYFCSAGHDDGRNVCCHILGV